MLICREQLKKENGVFETATKKYKHTMNELYGVDNPMKSGIIKEKANQTSEKVCSILECQSFFPTIFPTYAPPAAPTAAPR